MRQLLHTALLLIPSLMGLGITGCSGGAEDDNRDGKALAIYNWADYIGKNTVANFEQRTGIHVDYDTFDVDATLEAKMLTGGSGYIGSLALEQLLGFARFGHRVQARCIYAGAQRVVHHHLQASRAEVSAPARGFAGRRGAARVLRAA